MLLGKPLEEQPVFNKYFDGSEFPKFILFSAHSSLAYEALRIFNLKMIEHSQPASALFLEFFEVDGEDRVRVFFKEDPSSDNLVPKLLQN